MKEMDQSLNRIPKVSYSPIDPFPSFILISTLPVPGVRDRLPYSNLFPDVLKAVDEGKFMPHRETLPDDTSSLTTQVHGTFVSFLSHEFKVLPRLRRFIQRRGTERK